MRQSVGWHPLRPEIDGRRQNCHNGAHRTGAATPIVDNPMRKKVAIILTSAAILGVCGVLVTQLRPGAPSTTGEEQPSPAADSAAKPHATRAPGRISSGSRLSDPIERLKAASEEEFAESLGRIVSAWDGEKLPDDLKDLFKGPAGDPQVEELRSALLRRWASMEPAEAARWAMSLPHETDRTFALEQVVLAWSTQDPDAAFEWLKSLPEDPARNQGLATLAYETSRAAPSKAFEMTLPLIGTPEGLRCMEHAVANWALLDPQAALARVRELPDTESRDAALASLATSWAESDPAAAGTFVSEAMEDGSSLQRAVAAIVQRWAQKDPQAVSSWVASFPEGSMKENALILIKEQTSAKSEAP